MHERCVPAVDAGATATVRWAFGNGGDPGGDRAAGVGADRAAFDGNGKPRPAGRADVSDRGRHRREGTARARGRPLDPIV